MNITRFYKRQLMNDRMIGNVIVNLNLPNLGANTNLLSFSQLYKRQE